MTKTLTEKWKDGELIFGKTYWCSDDEGNIAKLVLVSEDRFYEWTLGTEVTKDVKEVLAPVPSYDEYKQLTDMDEELKNLACKNDTLAMENGKLQERLADADKALKYMDEKYGEHYTIADGTKMGNSPAWKYLLKWGVK